MRADANCAGMGLKDIGRANYVIGGQAFTSVCCTYVFNINLHARMSS